jgi:hypothetical protein
MAVQLSVTTRNARLDAIESTAGASCSMSIFSGSVPADCAAANPSGLLWTLNLPSDWMAGAGSGSKAKAGTWSGSASAGGVAASFRVYNSQATKDGTTCIIQGTVAQGSGDLSLDNTNIANGQTVTINTFTLTDGNA